MSAYLDTQDLKDSLSLQGQDFADADIERAIVTASDALDLILNTRFGLTEDEAGEARIYTLFNENDIPVDGLTEVVSVTVDRDGDGVFEETWVEGTDFRLEPLNAPGLGRPYDRLVMLTGKTIPRGRLASVKVTGLFGWAEVPVGIQTATGIIATQYILRARQAPFGFVINADTVARIARTDPQVLMAIAPYDRTPILV